MENKDLGLVLLIIGALGFSEQITKILKLKNMYKFVYYVFVLSLGYCIYTNEFKFNFN